MIGLLWHDFEIRENKAVNTLHRCTPESQTVSPISELFSFATRPDTPVLLVIIELANHGRAMQ